MNCERLDRPFGEEIKLDIKPFVKKSGNTMHIK